MNKIRKIVILGLVVFGFSTVQSFAQQITKFGVVNTAKVYSAYFKDSAAVKNYETKKTEFQNEANKRAEEIRNLKQKKVEYQKNGDTANAQKLDADIKKKTDYLVEYTNTKNVELESMLSNLQKSDDFYKKLYKTLAKVAEKEGYSMILSLQDTKSILWYSPSVDVTELVIAELSK